MIRKVLTMALAMCAMLALLSTMAIAKGDGDEGSSATYFGLTITCQNGEIAGKVSSDDESKEIQIIAGGTYTISGTRSLDEDDWNGYTYAPTREVISVTTEDEVTLILDNVTIQAPDFDIQGQAGGIVCGENSNVHIVLQGTNTLDMSTYYNDSRSMGSAGIGLKNNAKLVISGSGSLVAKGGQNHPGIGMLTGNSNGNITINGGTIEATGGNQGAGIGCYGGSGGTVGDILIEESTGEKIHLTAIGGTNSGAGIGSGLGTGYGSITIRSGEITATANPASGQWSYGAGIGGSAADITTPTLGEIKITGGTVTATGTAYGAGIGGGRAQFPAITITGGDIHAYGKYYGAGIGGGNSSKVTDDSGITITGGTIYSASSSGNGIGAGSGGKAGTVSISGTAAVTAFSGSALAIHETATVKDRSILNVQFADAMPGSINLLEGGATAGSLSDIPRGAKAFAYTFDNTARELQIQDGTEGREQYFAVYKDGTDSKDTYSLSADGMLTKTGLTWEEKQPTRFTITATAGANGSITPSGKVSVEAGGSQTFTITPNEGYEIADVLVDGVSVGAVSSYTFSGVQANRTIEATFAYDMPANGGVQG